MNQTNAQIAKYPLRWIPSLYFLEGFIYALVTMVSLVLYKNFQISNTKIAFYTSLFTLPWFLKPLLAPALETLSTRRTFIIIMPSLTAILTLVLMLVFHLQDFFYLSIILFLCIAFAASIFDMNTDGFYIKQLRKQEQAYFIGIRTVFYQIGRLAAQGGAVLLASVLFFKYGMILSWQIIFALVSLTLLIITIYHYRILPAETTLHARADNSVSTKHHFENVWREFATLPQLSQVLLFIFLYQFAENQLIKIFPLYLMDTPQNGGLGLSTASVGIVNGGFNIIAMLAGILLSGTILARIELKRCLVPITVFAGVTNIGYLYLSLTPSHSILGIGLITGAAQFGFGLSNGAYMFYLLQAFGKGPYSMSLYAIGTAIMGFGVIFGGAISGYIQYLLGYTGFFIWIVIASVGMIAFSYYLTQKGMEP